MADNIISPNVPNAITITLMAVIGGAILSLIRKGIMARKASSDAG